MADFKISVVKTLQHEGGYVNDSQDSGGETNMGISKREYPDLDIKNLTQDQAVEIYREGYWKNYYSQIADQSLADKIFDLGVLFGVGTTVKVLQIVLGLTPDGAFGPTSLEKLNSVDPSSCLAAFKTGMVTHCLEVVKSNPNDRRYFAGWVRRINS